MEEDEINVAIEIDRIVYGDMMCKSEHNIKMWMCAVAFFFSGLLWGYVIFEMPEDLQKNPEIQSPVKSGG